MARSRSRRDANLRRRLAYVAARMMAEDGVAGYGAAKMKAARQEGLADANLLREYQGLYQSEEQPVLLRHLREVAVRVMRELDAFRPVLVGSVLSGTAGQHSDVNLQVFAEDAKALAMFLVNKRYRFEEGSKRLRRGDRHEDVPQYSLDIQDVTVTLTVLDPGDERSAPRVRDETQPPVRARLAEVEAMLALGAKML